MKKIIAALMTIILLFGSISFADEQITGEWIVTSVIGSGGSEALQGFRDCQDWFNMTVSFRNGVLHTVAKNKYEDSGFESDAIYMVRRDTIWINGDPAALLPGNGTMVITDGNVCMTLTRTQSAKTTKTTTAATTRTAASNTTVKQSNGYTSSSLNGTWKLSSFTGKGMETESAVLSAGLQLVDLFGANVELKCQNGNMTLTAHYTRKGEQKSRSFGIAYEIRNNKLILDFGSVPAISILCMIIQTVDSTVNLTSEDLKAETFDIRITGNELLIGDADLSLSFIRQ